jgi:hypothetical protein
MAYTGSKAFVGQGSILSVETATSPPTYQAVAEMKKVDFTGSKADQVDVTNMDSGAYREFKPTLLDAGDLSFTANYIPNDMTQQELFTLFNGRTIAHWKLGLPDSSIETEGYTTPGFWEFDGFVSARDFNIETDKASEITGKIKITGEPTFTPESA